MTCSVVLPVSRWAHSREISMIGIHPYPEARRQNTSTGTPSSFHRVQTNTHKPQTHQEECSPSATPAPHSRNMNRDGDILGSRRRVEPSQAGITGVLAASALPGSSSDVAGASGSTRHPPGASPLKRQRSAVGGPARVESEVSRSWQYALIKSRVAIFTLYKQGGL